MLNFDKNFKNEKMTFKILSFVMIIAIFIGCKDSKQEYIPVTSSTKEVNKTKEAHEVVVKEIEKAGGYIYARVSEKDEEYWIALPKTNIEVGKTYYYNRGTKMTNFNSNELNKTFEEVIFVEALRGHKEKVPKAITSTTELIAQPQGGTSIKDVLENASSYSGKDILVKGKVVKVNNGILDRNWVHISDGTSFGDKSRLTFTTTDTLKVNDIVTFKGMVTIDKDFGYGYVYPVLIEKAKLVK